MNTAMMLLGWVIVACLSVLAATAGIALVLDGLRRLLERHDNRIYAQVSHDVGNRLLGDAWWFGESPDVTLALKLYGQRFMRNEWADVNQVREDWRRQRTPDEATAGMSDEA